MLKKLKSNIYISTSLLKANLLILFAILYSAVNAQEESDFILKRNSKLEIYQDDSKFSLEQNTNYQLAKKDNFAISFIETERKDKFITLSQTYNNVEVFGSSIKTVFDDNGKSILSSSSILENLKVKKSRMPSIEEVKTSGIFNFDEIKSYKHYYFPLTENLITASIKVNYSLDGKNYFIFLDSDLNTLYIGERYISKKAGEIKKASASVFMPDPITSSNKVYGGDYAHNLGTSNASLEAEQYIVEIDSYFENGTYYLENDYIKIVDLFSPYWNVVTSVDGNFIYNRSQLGFQQVNAFYHLSEMKNQLNNYGFTDAVNYKLRVDADGSRGVDNSYFHPHDYEGGELESNSKLEFGAYVESTNNIHVPDAEDAEVIIHEYAHAIINSYARERISLERQCLEEAFADYIAVSYATSINDNNWEKIFKWDAHNGIWPGRYATSDKCYKDLKFNDYNNIKKHTDIWVAPLMDLYFSIGREATDKLVLHSLAGLDANTTMEQAALIMLSMDQVYNSNKYSQEIFETFKKYCILSDENIEYTNNDYYKVLNSENFTKGSFLTIQFKEIFSGNIKIINMNGNIISSENFKNKYFITVDSKNLINGIFLIKIESDNFVETFKTRKL